MDAKTIYYVATLVDYVLVEAESEAEALQMGRLGLICLRAERGQPVRHDAPFTIRIVCPATNHEIELDRWNREMFASEQGA